MKKLVKKKFNRKKLKNIMNSHKSGKISQNLFEFHSTSSIISQNIHVHDLQCKHGSNKKFTSDVKPIKLIKEKQKQAKNVKYNLNVGGELTHLGLSLSNTSSLNQILDFDLIAEPTDQVSTFCVESGPNKIVGEGRGVFIKEIIDMCKEFKHEQQKNNGNMKIMTEKLDKTWKDLRTIIKNPNKKTYSDQYSKFPLVNEKSFTIFKHDFNTDDEKKKETIKDPCDSYDLIFRDLQYNIKRPTISKKINNKTACPSTFQKIENQTSAGYSVDAINNHVRLNDDRTNRNNVLDQPNNFFLAYDAHGYLIKPFINRKPANICTNINQTVEDYLCSHSFDFLHELEENLSYMGKTRVNVDNFKQFLQNIFYDGLNSQDLLNKIQTVFSSGTTSLSKSISLAQNCQNCFTFTLKFLNSNVVSNVLSQVLNKNDSEMDLTLNFLPCDTLMNQIETLSNRLVAKFYLPYPNVSHQTSAKLGTWIAKYLFQQSISIKQSLKKMRLNKSCVINNNKLNANISKEKLDMGNLLKILTIKSGYFMLLYLNLSRLLNLSILNLQRHGNCLNDQNSFNTLLRLSLRVMDFTLKRHVYSLAEKNNPRNIILSRRFDFAIVALGTDFIQYFTENILAFTKNGQHYVNVASLYQFLSLTSEVLYKAVLEYKDSEKMDEIYYMRNSNKRDHQSKLDIKCFCSLTLFQEKDQILFLINFFCAVIHNYFKKIKLDYNKGLALQSLNGRNVCHLPEILCTLHTNLHLIYKHIGENLKTFRSLLEFIEETSLQISTACQVITQIRIHYLRNPPNFIAEFRRKVLNDYKITKREKKMPMMFEPRILSAHANIKGSKKLKLHQLEFKQKNNQLTPLYHEWKINDLPEFNMATTLRQQRKMMQHVLKRDLKTAKKDLRKESASLAHQKFSKQLESDRERNCRVKRIYSMLAIQEGEVCALKRAGKGHKKQKRNDF